MGLYKFIEGLCELSAIYGQTIVSQWDDVALVIEPGDDPYTTYADMREAID